MDILYYNLSSSTDGPNAIRHAAGNHAAAGAEAGYNAWDRQASDLGASVFLF